MFFPYSLGPMVLLKEQGKFVAKKKFGSNVLKYIWEKMKKSKEKGEERGKEKKKRNGREKGGREGWQLPLDAQG